MSNKKRIEMNRMQYPNTKMKIPTASSNATVSNSYSCSKCDYVTHIGYNLRRHMILKHQVVGEDIYNCQSCRNSYHTMRKLSVHQLTCTSRDSSDKNAQKATSRNTEAVILGQELNIFNNIENRTDNEQEIPQPKASLNKVNGHLPSNLEINKTDSASSNTNRKIEPRKFFHYCSECTGFFAGLHEYQKHKENCMKIIKMKASITEVKKMVCESKLKLTKRSAPKSSARSLSKNTPLPSKSLPLLESKKEEHNPVSDLKNIQKNLKKCNICLKKFERQKSLNLHLKYFHECPRSLSTTDRKIISKRKSLPSHREIDESHPPFKCKFCQTLFRHKRNLLRHTKYIHENPNSFKCNLCDKLYSYKRNLEEHIKFMHGQPQSLTCNFCKLRFTTIRNLDFHILQCHTTIRRFECNKCDFKANRKDYYRKHLKYCGGNQLTDSTEDAILYHCHICQNASWTIPLLIMHMKTHNETEEVAEERKVEIDDKLLKGENTEEREEKVENNAQTPGTFKVLEKTNEIDEKATFQDSSHDTAHSLNSFEDLENQSFIPEKAAANKIDPRKVLKVSLSKYDETLPKIKSAKESGVSDGKSSDFRVHVCPKCMDFFQDYGEYALHVQNDICFQNDEGNNSKKIVNGLEITLPVVQLEKVPIMKISLPIDVAQSKSKTEDKVRNCPMTRNKLKPNFKYMLRKKIFGKKGYPASETIMNNDDTIPSFKCNICQKKYDCRRRLESHMDSTHTTTYKCHICTKRFINRNNLDFHIKRLHGKTSFQCQLCPKTFAYYSYLQFHIKGHQNPDSEKLQCNLCHKYFGHKSNLDFHILEIHTTIRRHRCSNCDFESNRKDTYSNHVKKCFQDRKLLSNRNQRNINAKTGKEEERDYRCPICTVVFLRTSSLVNHMKTHNEVDLQGKCVEKQAGRFDNGELERSNTVKRKRGKVSVSLNASIAGKDNQANSRIGRLKNDVPGKSTTMLQDGNRDVDSFNAAERGEITEETKIALAKALENLYSYRNVEQDLSIYQCKLCSVTCLNSNALDIHMKRHRP